MDTRVKGREAVLFAIRSLSFRSRPPPPPLSGFFEGNEPLDERLFGKREWKPFCCRVLGVIVSGGIGRVTFGETIFADPFDATWMRWRVIMARRGSFFELLCGEELLFSFRDDPF